MVYYLGKPFLFEDPSIEILSLEDFEKIETDFETAVGLDLETTGLDFVENDIVLVSLSNKQHQYVLDWRYYKTQIGNLLQKLIEKNTVFIGANIKFDYKFLLKYGIRLGKVYDVILAERVLNNGRVELRNSLKDIANRRVGVNLVKATATTFVGMSSNKLTYAQVIYSAEDVAHLHEIATLQTKEAKMKNQLQVIYLENFATLAFGDIEFNGFKIDQQKWKLLAEKAGEQSRALSIELDDYVLSTPKLQKFVPKYIQTDAFIENIRRVDINWDSPIQVLKILQVFFPDLESVEAPQLEKFQHQSKLVSKYLAYKEYRKLFTTYGLDFFKYISKDGLIHTEINQMVSTGRTSFSNPNLQQIPAPNEYRNCFLSPDDQMVFVSSDYVSQELTLIAYASNDPVWLEALKLGHDLHSVCAELVFKEVWKEAAEDGCAYYQTQEQDGTLVMLKHKCKCKKHKKLRDAIKSINFGLSYGMSEFKLSAMLNITVKEAKGLINSYFTTFPNIRSYLNSSADFGVSHGYITTLPPWKRVRYFHEWYPGIEHNPDNFNVLGSIERKSKNTPIQGAGADICKYALGLMRVHIHENQLPVKIVCMVHDQIDTVTTPEFAQQWSETMKMIMEKAALYSIPEGLLKADVTISNVWMK